MAITINKSVYGIGDVVFYLHTDGSIRKGEVQEWRIMTDGTAVYTVGGGGYSENNVSNIFETLRAIKEAKIVFEIDEKQLKLLSIKALTEADIKNGDSLQGDVPNL